MSTHRETERRARAGDPAAFVCPACGGVGCRACSGDGWVWALDEDDAARVALATAVSAFLHPSGLVDSTPEERAEFAEGPPWAAAMSAPDYDDRSLHEAIGWLAGSVGGRRLAAISCEAAAAGAPKAAAHLMRWADLSAEWLGRLDLDDRWRERHARDAMGAYR